MTSFSMIQGTQPDGNFLTRFRKSLKNSSNQDLYPAIQFSYFNEVRRLLTKPYRNLEEPYVVTKAINEGFRKLWRTPLEHALDVGQSWMIVSELLNAGSVITKAAQILAIDNVCDDWIPHREADEITRANLIIDTLTEFKTDWHYGLTTYGMYGNSRNRKVFHELAKRLLPNEDIETSPAGWPHRK